MSFYIPITVSRAVFSSDSAQLDSICSGIVDFDDLVKFFLQFFCGVLFYFLKLAFILQDGFKFLQVLSRINDDI